MLELLTLIEHAALYLSLPVLCIWSLVRGSPETKFVIWGVMAQFYFANFLKHIFQMEDGSAIMRTFSAILDLATFAIVVRNGRSIFLLIFVSSVTLTWISTAITMIDGGELFWSAMVTSELFTWVSHSCFALALLSDDRFPNAHWRDVLKLARFWR